MNVTRGKKIMDSPLHSIKSKTLSNQSDIADEDQRELDEMHIQNKEIAMMRK